MKPASRYLLLAGFVVAIGLIATATWAGWRQFERVEGAAALVTRTQEVLTRIARVLSLVQDVETGSRGFVVTGDPAFLKPFDDARATLDAELAGLCGVVDPDPEQRASCAELSALARQRIAGAAATAELRRAEGFEAAQKLVASGAGKAIMDQIRQVTDRMEAKEHVLLDRRTSESRFTARATNIQTTFAMGLSLFLLIATFAVVVLENRRRQASEESLRASETRIARLHSDLQVHAAGLAAANRELESCSYSVSHDLRAPSAASTASARSSWKIAATSSMTAAKTRSCGFARRPPPWAHSSTPCSR